MAFIRTSLFVCALALLSGAAPHFTSGQNQIGTGKVRRIYQKHCARCHGENLRGGGAGGSLVDGEWAYIGGDASLADYIKAGNAEQGMPGFDEALSDPQVRSLAIYIKEMRQKARQKEAPDLKVKEGVFEAGGHRFRMEKTVGDLGEAWSLEFLPDGRMLISERGGDIHVFEDGRLSKPLRNTPEVVARNQGGMLDIGVHPDFEENGWIYLAYSQPAESRAKGVAMTAVARGRIRDGAWTDEEIIFEAPDDYHFGTGHHFGTRLVFRDGYLFFSIGDRGKKRMAQDLSVPNGKIHRIHDDGEAPDDNPFANREDAWPTIWAYGNRNPQGLDLNPVTGRLWESEHGPRGGDEINLIEKGLNYGWPEITYGMNYNGTPITDRTSAPGMEQPKHYWTPSIAVCGMDFYEGDRFPEWRNDLFVGGLASNELHRLVIEDREVVSDTVVLKDQGRVRDVKSGPDGALYVVLNGPGAIVRLVPAPE